MNKLFCFLFSLIISSFFCLRSQTNVDSLINIFSTQELSIDKQLELYVDICDVYSKYDPESSILYAEEGVKLAEKKKSKNLLSRFYEFMAMGNADLGKYEEAQNYYDKAYDLEVETGNEMRQLIVLANKADSYGAEGKYERGLEVLMEALPLCEKLDNKRMAAKLLNSVGSMYRMLRNNKQAIYYLTEAKNIVEKEGDEKGKNSAYYNLGSIYRFEREYDKALEYALKAAEISEKNDYKVNRITAGLLLSKIYMEGFLDFKKAEEYAEESLKKAREFGEPRLIASSLSDLSYIYREQGLYEKCEAIALQAWELDSTRWDAGTNILSDLVISNIYLGNKDKAADYFDKFGNYLREYIDENFQEKITEMGVKYETEKKEMQIASLEEKQKLYIGLGIISVLVLLLIIALLLVNHRLNRQKRKIAEQQIKQLEQEKQLIATQAVLDGETAERSRLARDLHDGLGGMLSVVKLNLKNMKSYSILEQQDVEQFGKALEMLDQSMGELRRVAHHMMPEALMRYGLRIALEDFCKAIPGANFYYMGIERRLDERMEIELYRCAYELINNALKHAEATAINVQLLIEEKIISLSVQDNGKGFDPEKIIKGAGLDNIRTRVSAYNGKINIHTSSGNGTEISIEIENY